jgi:acetolactate synthase-1/2/3 large subunit
MAKFARCLRQAQARKGIRLLHLVIDVEQLSAGGASVSGLRAKAGT